MKWAVSSLLKYCIEKTEIMTAIEIAGSQYFTRKLTVDLWERQFNWQADC